MRIEWQQRRTLLRAGDAILRLGLSKDELLLQREHRLQRLVLVEFRLRIEHDERESELQLQRLLVGGEHVRRRRVHRFGGLSGASGDVVELHLDHYGEHRQQRRKHG